MVRGSIQTGTRTADVTRLRVSVLMLAMHVNELFTSIKLVEQGLVREARVLWEWGNWRNSLTFISVCWRLLLALNVLCIMANIRASMPGKAKTASARARWRIEYFILSAYTKICKVKRWQRIRGSAIAHGQRNCYILMTK